MSVAWPISEVIPPQFADQMSYTGKKFRSFCIWRDNKAIHSDGWILRLTSQVVFVILRVAATFEFYILAITSQGHLSFPLLHAFKTSELAKRVLSFGSSEKNVSSKLKAELGISGMCYNLFPFGSLEKKFVETKLLSHWLELEHKTEVKEGIFEKYEGLPFGINFFTLQSIANSLRAFSQSNDFTLLSISKEKVLYLANAFSLQHPVCLDINNAKKIQNKELCFLQCVWGNHNICLAFFGNYMAIGNRGEGSGTFGTLAIFKIDPALMTKEIIKEMQKSRTTKEGMEYFYQTLPTQLTKNGVACQDALCVRFQNMQPPYQIIGNCPLSSAQSALRFAWAMLLDPMPNAEVIHKAEAEVLFFEKYAGMRYMNLIHPPEQFQNPKSLSLISTVKTHSEKTYKTIATHLHNTVCGKRSFFDKFLFKKWIKYVQVESRCVLWIDNWSYCPSFIKVPFVWCMTFFLTPPRRKISP